MTIEELDGFTNEHPLFESVKNALRLSTDRADSEVTGLMSAAIHDMLVKGVSADWLGTDVDSLPALARQAVVVYAKANFGYDNDDADRFLKVYDSMVATMLNSSHNAVYGQRSLSKATARVTGEAKAGDMPTLEVLYPVGGAYLMELTEGNDYTVSYEHNLKAGTALATVTGVAPYVGIITVPYTAVGA